MLGALARRLFGTANDRYVKSLGPLVEQINDHEAELEQLSDEALRAKTAEFKQRIAEAHREQMLNCKRFRGLLSSNVVRAFDKWL